MRPAGVGVKMDAKKRHNVQQWEACMEVVADGEPRLYEHVPPGGLFATYLDGEFRYCLKTLVYGDEGHDHPAVVLVPGHDDHDGQPGIFAESHFDDTTVAYLPLARLTLRSARAAMSSMNDNRKAGEVICRLVQQNPTTVRAHIVVGDPHKRLVCVHLADGHIEALGSLRKAMVYRSWSITTPSMPGFVELANYP
jgi:hypothetical protein